MYLEKASWEADFALTRRSRAIRRDWSLDGLYGVGRGGVSLSLGDWMNEIKYEKMKGEINRREIIQGAQIEQP